MGTGSKNDGSAFLTDCLDSFIATRTMSDLIVVNDGSSDDTDLLLGKYKIGLCIRFPQNEGLRDAFSAAVHNCRTKYFLRVDADIVFTTPQWDALLVKHMELHPECGVCGATQLCQDGKIWSAGDSFTPRYHHMKDSIIGEYRICDSVMGCFSCYRAAAWGSAGGLTAPKWIRSETEDLNLRIQKYGAVPGAMGHYECHCLPMTFEHHHWMAKPKTGKYNDMARQKRDIQTYMMEHHGVDFYGKQI